MLKLLHGPCEKLLRQIPDNSVDALVTDPPWGLGFLYGNKKEETDNPEAYWKWLRPRYELALSKVKPGGFVAIWQATTCIPYFWQWFGPQVRLLIAPSNFPVSSPQTGFTFSLTPIAAFYKAGAKMLRPRKFVNNWDCLPKSNMASEAQQKSLHPCPRPLDECRRIVEWFTVEKGTVLDPFMGSGTIGLAAQIGGRSYIGIEMDNEYYNYAVNRITTRRKSGTGKFHPTFFKRD